MKLKNPLPAIFLIGDALALLLFVFIGERDHGIADSQPVLRLFLTAGFFYLPWVIAAWLLDAFPTGMQDGLRILLGRSLNAWLIAAPLGALLRSFANGTGVILSPFLAVTLVVGGCFMLGWRCIFALINRRRLSRA
jgi:Protein of unknown function (DUF3054)